MSDSSYLKKVLEDKTRELERVSDRFRTIIEALPNGIIMVDRCGRITLCNRETERLFGYSRKELVGQTIEMLVPDRFKNHHSTYRNSFFESPKTRAMGAGRDLYGKRKDDTEFPIEIGLNPLKTDDGDFVLAAIVDITERKAAEERFRSVVESTPNALVIVNSQGQMTLVNSQTEYLFGYDRKELVGQPIEILVPHRFRNLHPGFRDGFFKSPKARPMGAGRDLFGLRKDGVEIPVEIGLKPFEMKNKRHVLAAVVDISERKLIEAKLRQTNQELQQKNQEMEQFIYTVSHDLKAPIVTSMSFIEFIREDLANHRHDDIEDSFGRLERANRRMAQLIDDLLRLSRAGRIELQPEVIDMYALIGDVCRDLDERFKGVTADIDIQKDMPKLKADRSRIMQLFENLVSNALKYGASAPEPRIWIGSTETADEIRYFVRDNGPGIIKEFHKRVFGLFERLATNKEGTGVGLAIVSRVAQLHGGHAWVESAEQKGATFWVAFPKTIKSGERSE